ncbi:MAG: DUF6259 domain-containing protein [Acidobacteriia bacterium]|nr:DUF6259 domain-containing protein [Terriglobia bacterium]
MIGTILHSALVAMFFFSLQGAVWAESVTVENSKIALRLEANERGIALTSIYNKSTGVEHLSGRSPLFELSANGFTIPSNNGTAVDKVSTSDQSAAATIWAHCQQLPLEVRVDIKAPAGESVAIVQIDLMNRSPSRISVRVVAPNTRGIVTSGPASARMGAIPQEIGSVVPLENTAPPSVLRPQVNPPVGMPVNADVGLPRAMNSMELASIYDAGGTGGIFFADIDGDLDNGISPIEFNLSAAGVAGYWRTDLEPGQDQKLPRFAIGVQSSGDWHAAVDYYVAKHRPRWKFPPIPAWFRDQGAIYGYSGGGAGAIYLLYPEEDLRQRIDSFRQLPKLLTEAQHLGTNIVYIWDYWEGSREQGGRNYFVKGDYLPRPDLGGVPAFVEGVKAVHQQGGRVIVYVEAFIITNSSKIGQEKGQEWGGRNAAGDLYAHYRNNYSMVAPFVPWQDYIVQVAERLVRDYGVDGIFLDSYAYQMNQPMQTQAEGILYSPAQYSQGVLTLTDRVRNAIQAIKPDAVVLGETTAGPIARHWHGGLSTDFAWRSQINQGRILASPVRYGIPEVNFITSGKTLNEMNQVFAAGHNLALCDAQLPFASYIRPLVEIRKKYKDALIYGSQSYQPATGSPDVAAYYYEGAANRVVTAVNISSQRHYLGHLRLRDSDANTTWQDLVSNEIFKAQGAELRINIPPEGLRVLVRK